jgi:uncharacterized protein
VLLIELEYRGLISPPRWLASNCMYLTLMGSVAYGTSSDASDTDVYGFTVPPRDVVFPHLAGSIEGFGRHKQRFEQWQQHHIVDELHKKEYDFSIFNIVRYFSLLMENNPNLIDSVFTPTNCVLHCTKIGNMLRDNRKMFLHNGCWHKFKGYAYGQLAKMNSEKPEPGSKRAALREKFGMDVKFAMHTVRLLYEAEMILQEGDIDLQRHREHLKSIRRGEVSEEEIRQWADEKEKALERLYETSQLQHSPNESKIKNLLLACLEEHYGNLKDCVVVPEAPVVALREIQSVLDRNRHLLGT